MSPETSNLAATLDTAARLAGRLERSIAALAPVLPVAAADLERVDEDHGTEIDAFLKRWEQLQDALSNRVIRALLVELTTDVAGMSARDAFDRVEGLGALGDAGRFHGLARLRNRLVHEYPMSAERRAERINAAWASARVLLEEQARLAAYAAPLIVDGEAR